MIFAWPRSALAPVVVSGNIVCYGATAEQKKTIATLAADSVTRTHFYADPKTRELCDATHQSPYRIVDCVEFKTAWHPIGI